RFFCPPAFLPSSSVTSVLQRLFRPPVSLPSSSVTSVLQCHFRPPASLPSSSVTSVLQRHFCPPASLPSSSVSSTGWMPCLIDGYSDERRGLEEQVREGTALQQQLEVELQITSSRLQELQQEKQEVGDQQDLLPRQQDAIMCGAREAEL
ncbi:A-kinase anchor protein 9 isoform X1, partial [Tachysurus ichikawai]